MRHTECRASRETNAFNYGRTHAKEALRSEENTEMSVRFGVKRVALVVQSRSSCRTSRVERSRLRLRRDHLFPKSGECQNTLTRAPSTTITNFDLDRLITSCHIFVLSHTSICG